MLAAWIQMRPRKAVKSPQIRLVKTLLLPPVLNVTTTAFFLLGGKSFCPSLCLRNCTATAEAKKSSKPLNRLHILLLRGRRETSGAPAFPTLFCGLPSSLAEQEFSQEKGKDRARQF